MCATPFHKPSSSDACAAAQCCSEPILFIVHVLLMLAVMSPKLGNVSDTETPMVV